MNNKKKAERIVWNMIHGKCTPEEAPRLVNEIAGYLKTDESGAIDFINQEVKKYHG